MIGLFSITRLVSIVAVAYAVLVGIIICIAVQFGDASWSISTMVSFALSGAGLLETILIVCLNFGWRRLWQQFPMLNRLLYPDIGGEWRIKINWHSTEEEGVVDAMAIIRQDFVRISMEVRSDSSDSQTLVAQPKKDPESGTPLLYYVFAVTPKSIGKGSTNPYFGAAILKFWEPEGGVLRGNYCTSSSTHGHFQLTR